MQINAKLVQKLMQTLGLSIAAGTFLAILAPFNTYNFTLIGRLVFWISLCIAGGIGANIFELIMDATGKSSKSWQRVLGSTIGATSAVSPFVILVNKTTIPKYILLTIFYIAVISLVISIIGALISDRSKSNMTSDNKDKSRPNIYERLPPKLRQAKLYAIGSEDHYVRVYTSEGEEMILMRLSDAIKDTHPIKGIRTHRSWWVAETGVNTLTRIDGKTKLTLKNNLDIPVSKSGYKALRTEGWL